MKMCKPCKPCFAVVQGDSYVRRTPLEEQARTRHEATPKTFAACYIAPPLCVMYGNPYMQHAQIPKPYYRYTAKPFGFKGPGAKPARGFNKKNRHYRCQKIQTG